MRCASSCSTRLSDIIRGGSKGRKSRSNVTRTWRRASTAAAIQPSLMAENPSPPWAARQAAGPARRRPGTAPACDSPQGGAGGRSGRPPPVQALASISSASSRFSVVCTTPRQCRFLHGKRVEHFWAPTTSPMAPASDGCYSQAGGGNLAGGQQGMAERLKLELGEI